MSCRDAYGHGLPDNWFDVVMDNPLMFNIEEAVNGHKIIYPNCGETLTEAPRTAATKEEPSVTHDEPDNSVAELRGPANALGRIRSDDLVLPWQEKYWNLYITHPKSTVEVWARLIGPEYSVSKLCHWRQVVLKFFFNNGNFFCFRQKWTR